MIKKLFILLLVMSFVFTTVGCFKTGLTVDQNAAVLTAIELGGYQLGYYIGKSKTVEDDDAFAAAYKLLQEGKLDQEYVAEALAKFKIDAPQLAGSLRIVLKRMGATFDPETGGLISLTGIPMEYWDAAAEGYASGFEFGIIGKKSLRNVSAVKALIPKKK